jgi:S1-C subfamily serine protease
MNIVKLVFGVLLICLPARADVVNSDNTDSASTTTASMERQYSRASVSVVEVGRADSSGYGTGTVFELDKKMFVLTAAHVVEGVLNPVIRKGSAEVVGNIVYYDESSDIAVISIDSSHNGLVPISTKFRKKSPSMGEKVFYCGYPNRKDIACFTGLVSHVNGDTINIHSYAWMGASGSAVLDKKGKIVGVLSAVEVGMAWGMPHIVEDVVWVRGLDESFWAAYENNFST